MYKAFNTNYYSNSKFLAKIFSIRIFVILAVCLFFIFLIGCTTEIEETDLLLPVNFLPMPRVFVKPLSYTKNIEIHIKGPSKLIKLIKMDNLNYTVDLYTDIVSDPVGESVFIKPGIYSIPVIEKRIPVFSNVEITNINPNFIMVELDRKISKYLPVSVPYIGKPASGYLALTAKTEPKVIEIKSGESIIRYIEKVETKPLDITGVMESFKKEVPLELDVSSFSSSCEIIIVSVPIQKEIITKKIKDITVKTKNCLNKCRIMPSKIQIQVKGHSNILKEPNILDKLEVYIDLDGLKQGVYVRTAVIKLPLDTILIGASPENFTVKIQ